MIPLLTLVCCLCEVVVMVAACWMLLLVPAVRMSCEAVLLELNIFGWQLSTLNIFGWRVLVLNIFVGRVGAKKFGGRLQVQPRCDGGRLLPAHAAVLRVG